MMAICMMEMAALFNAKYKEIVGNDMILIMILQPLKNADPNEEMVYMMQTTMKYEMMVILLMAMDDLTHVLSSQGISEILIFLQYAMRMSISQVQICL